MFMGEYKNIDVTYFNLRIVTIETLTEDIQTRQTEYFHFGIFSRHQF